MKLGEEESYRIIRSVLIREHLISDFLSHEDFLKTKIESLHLDDPPLSGEPDFEKKNLVIKIKRAYREKGIRLLLSDQVLAQKDLTLGEFVGICSKRNRQIEI